MSNFKARHSPEERRAETSYVRAKYPRRVPVICEKADRSDFPELDRIKYLVPADLSVGQFTYVIRTNLELPPEKAIFIFIGNHIPPASAAMSAVYEEKRDEDGFLYMTYSSENTFGGTRC